MQHQLVVRYLGRRPYPQTWQQMRDFTDSRDAHTCDEVWLVEHDPVFTQGQAGKPEHVLVPGDIPVVQSDRGGQVTYHGPGQLVVYFLIDLKRKKVGVRELVSHIENLVVATLAHYGVTAYARPDAPGVYVDSAKICSLGLRIRRGCSFHGLALNINMDLSPFQRINPCGYAGMAMTQLSDQVEGATLTDVQPVLVDTLTQQLGYTQVEVTTESSDL
ncbi:MULTISPECIES: lipoyl(octanoyl) transferase LipB [Salinivibrio]|uniref:Octanoyltransferase n=2 Tax=Salinivibrio TaxID=51366 RepID=A0ABY7LHQ6_9GAMM|nr:MULTISPECIES: lipoyl(octanoyl) transferase LipB [Salinivibrio]ODQ00939.1 octanoyltransferase [Salinivibrio sp. DV]OOF10956.1 octanoyltransferase [Salinivibrio sp. PR5]OOF21463.1 octanoyltransferase [Salinivibrio sp. IB574]OOF24883.1 octanoyltransferase [Salinivibrio proteolyticus]OOF28412.1 octanoyltransferase [Salinivibrio sp. IB872]